MIVTYSVNPEDYSAFLQNARWSSPKLKKRWQILRLLGTMAILISLWHGIRDIPAFYFNELFPTYSKTIFLLFHTLCSYFLVTPLVLQFSYFLKGKLELTKLNREGFFGVRELTIKENGFLLKGPNFTESYNWNEISNVGEDENHYFFYVTNERTIIIKKKADNLSEDEQKKLKIELKKRTESFLKNQPFRRFYLSVKRQVYLSLIYLVIIILSGLDWRIVSTVEAEKAVAELFEMYSESALPHELIIKEGVTQEQIDTTRRIVNGLDRFEPIDIFDSEKGSEYGMLLRLVNIAQEQLYEKQNIPMQQSYSGESETWLIENYQIIASPTEFYTISGTMFMKGKTQYIADYFNVEIHLVFNEELLSIGKEYLLHDEQVENQDIAEIETGYIPYAGFTKMDNSLIGIHNISAVYAIVEWKGKEENEVKKEKIVLHPNQQ